MIALARWLDEEVRLITAPTWRDEPPVRAFDPCTAQDPRCRRTLARLRAAGERMHRLGIPRLIGSRAGFTSAAATDVGALFARVVAIRGSATIIRPDVFRSRRG